ncbi:MAG: DUF1570 domain-containing protein, partial [Planctomycetaceae bacterium]
LLLLTLLFVATCSAIAAPQDRKASRAMTALKHVQKEQEEKQQAYSTAIAEVAKRCENSGFADEAAKIRELAGKPETRILRVQPLPSSSQPDISANLPDDEKAWRTELRRLRTEYAKEMYLLSRRALKAGYPSYAWQLVHETARQDPDHAIARRILGFKRQGDEWLTPFIAQMRRQNFVWHDQFGWLRKEQVKEYEAGKRYYRRWMSVEQEAEIRRDFKNAWEVRTEHYLVKTNHSLERGVEIAKALENYHDFFIQTYAGFFNTPEQMQKLFQSAANGPSAANLRNPYEVHYYRTRDEYANRLRSKVPQIDITNGLYYTSDRVAYFYFDPKQDNSDTIYHEATHQLFYENIRQERAIAVNDNFWIIEGIACYMESFHEQEGQWTLGDPKHIRIDSARYRFLNDGYYVPLSQFAAMGMQAFQSNPNIQKNYSQAAGLAHFFMHYDDGRYRDALVEHISQLYRPDPRGKNRVQSLEELTGTAFSELDREYGEYMKEMETSAPVSQAQKPN